MTPPIKIQLNSEDAIRSIIDGDPELQLEIKNKISCAVAKGYERIDQGVIEHSIQRLSAKVSDIVYEDLTTKEKGGWSSITTLKPNIKTLIEEKVRAEINSEIEQSIIKASENLQIFINERVGSIAGEIVRNTTTEIFDNSVRIEVNRRFEEIQKVIENGGE